MDKFCKALLLAARCSYANPLIPQCFKYPHGLHVGVEKGRQGQNDRRVDLIVFILKPCPCIIFLFGKTLRGHAGQKM